MLIGLVGKPSCGKSTFFKAATMADILIASYPFATIEPNHGVGYVRVDSLCSELGVKCNPRTGWCDSEKRFVPVELMDVAGLVKGASEGKGLGNQFLDNLRQADSFIHIVDISGTTDAEGKEGNGNPVEDVRMLETELDAWYAGILKKVWKQFTKSLQIGKADFSKAVAKQFSGLKVKEDDVKSVLLKLNLEGEKANNWDDREIFLFARGLRLETKPLIIAANKIDKPNAQQNLEILKTEFPDLMIIPCSADSELALREASNAGLIEYTPGYSNFKINEEKINEKQKIALESIKKNVLGVYGSTGVQNVLDRLVFDFMEYIAVFPAGSKLTDSKGNVLPDCFLLPPKSTALDFAYFLHSDIGDGFIKAVDVRTKKAVGKDYVLKSGDGIEILTK